MKSRQLARRCCAQQEADIIREISPRLNRLVLWGVISKRGMHAAELTEIPGKPFDRSVSCSR